MNYCISSVKTSLKNYEQIKDINYVGNLDCESTPCIIGSKDKKQINCQNFNYVDAVNFGCKKLLVSFDEKDYNALTPTNFNSTCSLLGNYYLEKPVVTKEIISYVNMPTKTIVQLHDSCFKNPIKKNSFKLSLKDSEILRAINGTIFNGDFEVCLKKTNIGNNSLQNIDDFISNARLMTELLLLT